MKSKVKSLTCNARCCCFVLLLLFSLINSDRLLFLQYFSRYQIPPRGCPWCSREHVVHSASGSVLGHSLVTYRSAIGRSQTCVATFCFYIESTCMLDLPDAIVKMAMVKHLSFVSFRADVVVFLI